MAMVSEFLGQLCLNAAVNPLTPSLLLLISRKEPQLFLCLPTPVLRPQVPNGVAGPGLRPREGRRQNRDCHPYER